jgi:peptidoglycan hydrolase-like protein with peptidoglycan-binding domain
MHPTLRKGDCNDFVRAWQIYLNAHGYDVGKSGCDGKFGSDTERAVMKYQQDHQIEAGYIGPQTWETIK